MTIAEQKLNIIHQIDELSEESLCEVEKLIAKLKAHQKINALPKKRRPHPDIAGKAKIIGDLIAPSVEIENIECLK